MIALIKDILHNLLWSNKTVRGFKGSYGGVCHRDFKFEVGQTYEHQAPIKICNSGFHFCRKMGDVFDFYSPYGFSFTTFERAEDFVMFEVEATQKTIHGIHSTNRQKSVTSKIKIIREVPRSEYKALI